MSAAGFLSGELIGFALCWRVERRDGVTLGFTSHDRDLVVDHLRYQSAPGMAPSALDRRAAADAASFEVSGALEAAAITEDDLVAGRWDGAAIHLLAVDWQRPEAHVEIARGTLGPVTVSRGRFTAEVRGPDAVLDRAIVEETSPECRAELGDRRCRVPLAPRTRLVRVVQANGPDVLFDAIEPAANGWGWGRLRWLDGANAGLASPVLASAGGRVTLAAPPAFALAPGVRAEAIEGCDKRLETCATRFGNAANFRGEPHLPGIDLLMRYPGQ